jgi:hypothetical protein
MARSVIIGHAVIDLVCPSIAVSQPKLGPSHLRNPDGFHDGVIERLGRSKIGDRDGDVAQHRAWKLSSFSSARNGAARMASSRCRIHPAAPAVKKLINSCAVSDGASSAR